MLKNKRQGPAKRLVLGLILGSGPVAAYAGNGWYVGLEGGFNTLNPQDFRIYGSYPQPGTVAGNVKSKDGYLAGFITGYAFQFGLRPELELDWRRNDYRSMTLIDGSPADYIHGYENTDTAMGNLWFDFFKSRSFHPYLGGGVGGARIAIRNAGYGFSGSVLGIPTAARDVELRNWFDVVLAYQYGGGINFDINDHWNASVDYRHLDSSRGDFNLLADAPDTHIETRVHSNSYMFSIRYSFAAPEQPAPPPPEPPVQVVPTQEEPPPPPPPPCQPPAPGQPINLEGCKVGDTIVLRGVNFEFDKATLTVNAKTLLDQVADALLARPDIKVEIDGHTDSKGSDAYNQKLSQRRAESVKQYLVGRGIDAGRMTTQGFGESKPVADNSTAEGRELNRRVELKITESNTGATAEPAAASAETSTLPASTEPPASPPSAEAPASSAEAPTSSAADETSAPPPAASEEPASPAEAVPPADASGSAEVPPAQ
jgi:outer membrane protein OmpA-like peptidoglycan-associated protein